MSAQSYSRDLSSEKMLFSFEEERIRDYLSFEVSSEVELCLTRSLDVFWLQVRE